MVVATDHSVWTLARMAECEAPDSSESPGAVFLRSVAEDVDEARAHGELNDDRLVEIADEAPNIYTYPMWREFVDLAAWLEDPSDLGADGSDMEQAARVCLYMIAERLARALADESTEDEDEASE